MTRSLAKLIFSIWLLIITTSSLAVIYPSKPSTSHGVFIVDQAHLINQANATEINALAKKLWKQKRVPLIVVTIHSLAAQDASSYSVPAYTQDLFDHWGVGSPSRNYGVLLLISKDDRKARIELGLAWNHRYDNESQRIMNQLIIPRFKAGDFSEGIVAGVQGLDNMVRGLALPKQKITVQDWLIICAFIIFIFVGIGVAISLIKSGRKGWGWALLVVLGIIIAIFLRAGSSSGGTFGGGSSGGGGASGGW